MTASELRSIGRTLWGHNHWPQSMAKALEVNERTVKRWANGQQLVPGALQAQLWWMLRLRRAEIDGLLEKQE